MRKKWSEHVEFVASETRDIDKEPNKLVMWNGGNGDLYLSILPASHKVGISMRFERSGGCSAKNPRLLKHLTACYDAIADNEDTTPSKKLEECYDVMQELVEGRENKDADAVEKAFYKIKQLATFRGL